MTVILGNPPYRRGTGDEGGWVTSAAPGDGPSFTDIIAPAQRAGVIFSAQASLYDQYVYFWRWALWKAMESRPDEPAVVSFITASRWLSGPAFVGLRELARREGDEIWVVDLGGEGRGAVLDDNVFAIQTPVAIVTVLRLGPRRTTPAIVRHRWLAGSRAEKLSALDAVVNPYERPEEWTPLPAGAGDRLVPEADASEWTAMPELTDLFPWQQPGTMFNRA